ncbi:uncharacterized protein HMPREF1541_10365 [Cyphellophora europaea CBS 101466]|uniref:Uncharacterized protein n=1 Tax=Cyphellophora europaea (strain CBS 101466) TaxID=1220924 RepID=W2S7T5_CYPE1|nr:uncharacterized protein HMPREF1541_10365 [Cyphellophora europaea CBS 101466]ETN44695.1 hypothetical protein HMPREF1541_10365 [Cyphellophora europaea CBS 101466]
MPGDLSPSLVIRTLRDQLFKNAPTPTQSFEGQTVIITGSNTGLGLEAAKHVVRLGCSKLIIAVRSVDKGETAKRAVTAATSCNPSTVEVWPLDLADYDSVKAFAARAHRELQRLDALIENAGVANFEWSWAMDNELMLTVNVVSTFLLAFLLLPKLRDTATRFQTTAHLTVVSSDGHFLVDFPEKDAPEGIFNALNDKSKTRTQDRYPVTKLMEVFVVRELAARQEQRAAAVGKPDVVINCVNPGFCKSELTRDIDGIAVSIGKFLLARTSEAGSRTLVHGAAGGPETHGQYMNLGKVIPPATVVVGKGGKETQEKLYAELVEKLEAIVPGVTQGYVKGGS